MLPTSTPHLNSLATQTDLVETELSNVEISELEGEKRLVFSGKKDPLSNFFEFPLFYGGRSFRSLEQALMFHRAMKLGNSKAAQKIMEALTPWEAKSLGKYLAGKDSEEYRAYELTLLRELLLEKLNQCAAFRLRLQVTRQCYLVHATERGRDMRWTSGLSPEESLTYSLPFPGQNLMGNLIMELRASRLSSTGEFGDRNCVNGDAVAVAPGRQTAAGVDDPRCFRCGERGHMIAQCYHPESFRCVKCLKGGHKATRCPNVPSVMSTRIWQQSGPVRFKKWIMKQTEIQSGPIKPPNEVHPQRSSHQASSEHFDQRQGLALAHFALPRIVLKRCGNLYDLNVYAPSFVPRTSG